MWVSDCVFGELWLNSAVLNYVYNYYKSIHWLIILNNKLWIIIYYNYKPIYYNYKPIYYNYKPPSIINLSVDRFIIESLVSLNLLF